MAGLACSLLCSAHLAQAQPVELTPEQLTQAALVALYDGDAARALAYSEALVGRDPQDFDAQVIRARALRDLGRYTEARDATRLAIKAAEGETEKFTSAVVMAQVQSSAGKKTVAQYWLRRAVEIAPSEAAKAAAIRDFKYLRATNPWSTRFTFSITPDSNVNDGSANDSSFLNYQLTELLFGQPVEYQLTGAARALPGIQYTFGLDTRYRLTQTEFSAHDLFFKADLRQYTLTEEARRTAPGVSGDDFSFASVFAGYGYRWLGAEKKTETALRFDAGHSWYGGSEYANYLRGALHHAWIKSAETKFGGTLKGERQFGIRAADIDTVSASFWGAHTLDSGHKLFWSLGAAQATSPFRFEEYHQWSVNGGVVLPNPILGASVQLGAGWRARDYDLSPHNRSGREDRELRGDVTFVFEDIDYHGFNPTMTLYGSFKDSNIALYESNKVGLHFGIQSAF
ncbi:MAG: surface lipoprotein assembly modifier [Paracoccaceae bacterium]